jgi:hypothetical protein
MGRIDTQYSKSSVEGKVIPHHKAYGENSSSCVAQVERTRHAVNLFRTGKLTNIGRGKTAPKPPDTPPRESGMRIVGPNQAGNRKSRVAMLHALANIEQWA